jgi:hypothetical protein
MDRNFEAVNTAFCRALLSMVMEDVKKVTTAEERKSVWTYHHMRDHWEFHGPRGFYWHGSADGGYDARAKGWHAFLAQHHPELEGYGSEPHAEGGE